MVNELRVGRRHIGARVTFKLRRVDLDRIGCRNYRFGVMSRSRGANVTQDIVETHTTGREILIHTISI